MPFVFLIMFAFFIHTNSVYDYYLAGVIGVLLADIVYHKRLQRLQSKPVAIVVTLILMILGLWLGGFPSYGTPVESYEPLGFLLEYNNGGYAIYHLWGVCLILLGCLIWNQIGMPDILSFKPFRWLGKNCYGIFLVHVLLIDYLGIPMMDYFKNSTGNIVTAAILTYVILLIVILVVAEIFNRTIEKWTGQIIARIANERV
jgi:peptidoglycan/LPS O-acetylase OafA/YrhL